MAETGMPLALDRECVEFTRYLTGRQPSPYAIEKYRDAHRRDPRVDAGRASRFDRLLVWAARAHPLGAWLVDSYTAVFFKPAIVRRKWVLVVAILESTAPTAEFFDVPDPGGRLALFARLGWRGLAFLAGLAASTVVFLPVRLLLAAASRGGRRTWIE